MQESLFLLLAFLHDTFYDIIIEASKVYNANKEGWDFAFLATSVCCVAFSARIEQRLGLFLLGGYLKIFPVFYIINSFYLGRYKRFTPITLQVNSFLTFMECLCFIFFVLFIIGCIIILIYYIILLLFGKKGLFKKLKN